MCVVIDYKLTKEFKLKNKISITAYKVLARSNNTLLSTFHNHIWQVGENKSIPEDSFFDKIYLWMFPPKYATNGIYVFLDKIYAKEYAKWTYNNTVVVSVKCLTEDLIAVGNGVRAQVAVFKKVFLAQEDYDEALKQPNRSRYPIGI